MHILTKLSLAILLFSSFLQAHEQPIVHLTPPKITPSTILEETYCTRPMREGKFNISTETINSKTIVNCYGHGGSGWTTLFGSVNKALALFNNLSINKNTPIRIIGSGCMGLTTAIELHRQGYNVAGIYTKELYDIPSWKAAGYFALVSVKTSPEEQEDLNKIGLDTFLAYQQIDQGKHPYITSEAVRLLPVFCSADTEAGVEDLEARGMIPPKEIVTLDFGNGTQHPNYNKFKTYFMNTSILMQQLTAEVQRLHIPIIKKTISNFNEITESTIFNCSGLGARELNNDKAMIPVRGHLIALNNTSGSEHMNYMIYTKVKQNGKEEYIYLFPKTLSSGQTCRGVLGGTFIPNVDKLSEAEQKALDEKEFQLMLERNLEFFGS